MTSVLPGIDVLATGRASATEALLQGRRLGLVSNLNGVTLENRPLLDVLHDKGMDVRALFTPEHGFEADVEGEIESGSTSSGLPMYSLYGATKRPTAEMLEGLEAIVFDLQDVGARFYTYSTTLFHLIEECAPRGITIVVLDRPNPIGDGIEGPLIESDHYSFIGRAPLPVTHGMTLGEVGGYFSQVKGLSADLHVVKVENWKRTQLWESTGLPWHRPSPNLPDWTSAAWYTGLALLEFSRICVGRGTSAPFQILGAPDFNPTAFLDQWQPTQNITAHPVEFVPGHATFEGQTCQGVQFEAPEPPAEPVAFGLGVMAALRASHPDFSREAWKRARLLVGAQWALDGLWEGQLDAVLERARSEAQTFRHNRTGALIYD